MKKMFNFLFKANLWLSFLIISFFISIFGPYGYDLTIREHLSSNTVRVVYYKKKIDRHWSGTGFQVRVKGERFIVTNRHVCKDAKELWIDYGGARTTHKVLKISKKTDLCLIEPLLNVDGMSLGTSSYTGQRVYTLGYAGGIPVKQFFKGEVSGFTDYNPLMINDDGEYMSKKKCMEFNGFMQRMKTRTGIRNMCLYRPMRAITTLIANYGSSGSAMINSRFQVVGVVFIKTAHFTAGAIPLSALHDFITKYQGEKNESN